MSGALGSLGGRGRKPRFSALARVARPYPIRRRNRVPVRRQLNATECGAACLAMILSYHGRKTVVEECRKVLGVGRDGLTALAIARAARAYGLQMRAYAPTTADLEHLPLPAIIHWNSDHFVVLERWSPRGAVVVDPASERRTLTPPEFEAGFSRVALVFEPGPRFERRNALEGRAWRSYLASLSGAPGVPMVLVQILLASFVLTVLGLAAPLLTKVLVDGVLSPRADGVMTVLGAGVLVIGLGQFTTSYLRGTLLVYAQAKLDSHMMLGFFKHLLSLPFAYFQGRTSGDLLMRLSSNTVMREALTNHAVSVILDGVLALVYALVLLTQAPLFGFLALGMGALQVAVLAATTPRMHGLAQRDLSAQAEAHGYMVEALTGISTLKASGTEDRALERWSGLFHKQLGLALRKEHLSALVDAATTTLRATAPLLMLCAGAFYVLEGGMSLGTMLALVSIATLFLTPISSLVSTGQQLQLVGASLERIADVMQAEPEQDPEKVLPAPRLTGHVEFRGVCFRYDRHAPWALRDASFTIRPGQKVALVGRTGSGKSTLAKLLLGLYEPTEGEILYDGIPLGSLDYRTLRNQFGAVLQDSALFSGSIRKNLSFNNPNLTPAELVEKAKMAAVHEEIERMPMGYETEVAEGGAALSGGQRQRLSLARALAGEPVLMVLDEATSHLDAATENRVSENVSTMVSCTRIVVAHRLSTVRDADRILVVDEGAIVEQGTHEELVGKGGPYSALIRSQLENGPGGEPS